jgi:hypothetical protein
MQFDGGNDVVRLETKDPATSKQLHFALTQLGIDPQYSSSTCSESTARLVRCSSVIS